MSTTWPDGTPKSTHTGFNWRGPAESVDRFGRIKTAAAQLLDNTSPQRASKAMTPAERIKWETSRVNGYKPLAGKDEAAKTFRILGSSF